MFLCITYNLQSHCVAHMWNCIHLEKITLWMSKKGYLNDISDESDGVQNPSNLPNKANLITIVPKFDFWFLGDGALGGTRHNLAWLLFLLDTHTTLCQQMLLPGEEYLFKWTETEMFWWKIECFSSISTHRYSKRPSIGTWRLGYLWKF